MILLDTHAWLWWVQGGASLPKSAADRIRSIDHGAELVSKDELIAKYPGVVVLWND